MLGANRVNEDVPEVGEDNWAHRSKRMRCLNCMWFVAKTTDFVPGREGHLGRCRRHAPTLGGFPTVFATDWCGDHKLDETRV